jgi:hypothetical protein
MSIICYKKLTTEFVRKRRVMSKIFFGGFILFIAILICQQGKTQEYKLRQVMTMQNAKMESTIYVKGKRQRVEGTAPGMGMNITVIEQCDLKRTIKLNNKNKLYIVQPFETPAIQLARQEKQSNTEKSMELKKGGVITMWYEVRDTGERKKMFGFTARHVWSTQKIQPSKHACSMKDSLTRKTDGWYIDLPQYECHRDYTRVTDGNREVLCQDKYEMHTSGKGKLGFPLFEKTRMIMGDGSTEMEMSIETIELSTGKLDTMLFTIPPGYQLVNKEEELFGISDINSMVSEEMGKENEHQAVINKGEKLPGKIRIGVYAPAGNGEVHAVFLQQKMVSDINAYNIDGIAINSEEEAKKYNCDYTLNAQFTNIKTAGKAAGVLNAIRRRDVTAATTYSIQGNMTLISVKDGSEKSKQAMDTKYEGNIDEAASRALDEAWQKVFKELR